MLAGLGELGGGGLSSVSQRLSGYPGFSVCTAGFVKAYADLCRASSLSACLLHTHSQRRVKPRVAPAGSGWLAGCSPYMPPSSSLLKSQSERTDAVLSSCM